jgi:hypothetical protein
MDVAAGDAKHLTGPRKRLGGQIASLQARIRKTYDRRKRYAVGPVRKFIAKPGTSHPNDSFDQVSGFFARRQLPPDRRACACGSRYLSR